MIVRAPRHQIVWLVRHGETNWNRMGWIQGHLDSPRLTGRGRAQARRVASLLATKEVGAVYSSDLRRARDTADPVARAVGCAVLTDPRLRERSFGLLEGSPNGTLRPEVTGIAAGRVVDTAARPVAGESLAQLADRCADFVSWLDTRPDDGDVVIVAHGGSIRLLRAVLAGTPVLGMAWGTVANASVHRLTVPPIPAGPGPGAAIHAVGHPLPRAVTSPPAPPGATMGGWTPPC